MKKIFVLIAMFFALTSCGNKVVENTSTEKSQKTSVESSEISSDKIHISSSIIPLSSVINTIGGEYVEVDNIIPAGVSPHGFDMSAKAMARLEDAEIVFMTGLDHIDGFLEKAASGKNQVHLAEGIQLLEATAHDHSEHEDEHHDEENHDEHGHDKDPHVWLGKENIIKIATKVRDELIEVLPEQAEFFETNTENFITELEAVYADFETQVAGKTPREFIVFHDAYNYLLESIEIDSNLKIPFSENVLHEAGTAHMAELIDEIELHEIKYIFREPQFSDTNLKKFQEQYNLVVATLDPLGADPKAAGYIANIKNNLESLKNIYE